MVFPAVRTQSFRNNAPTLIYAGVGTDTPDIITDTKKQTEQQSHSRTHGTKHDASLDDTQLPVNLNLKTHVNTVVARSSAFDIHTRDSEQVYVIEIKVTVGLDKEPHTTYLLCGSNSRDDVKTTVEKWVKYKQTPAYTPYSGELSLPDTYTYLYTENTSTHNPSIHTTCTQNLDTIYTTYKFICAAIMTYDESVSKECIIEAEVAPIFTHATFDLYDSKKRSHTGSGRPEHDAPIMPDFTSRIARSNVTVCSVKWKNGAETKETIVCMRQDSGTFLATRAKSAVGKDELSLHIAQQGGWLAKNIGLKKVDKLNMQVITSTKHASNIVGYYAQLEGTVVSIDGASAVYATSIRGSVTCRVANVHAFVESREPTHTGATRGRSVRPQTQTRRSRRAYRGSTGAPAPASGTHRPTQKQQTGATGPRKKTRHIADTKDANAHSQQPTRHATTAPPRKPAENKRGATRPGEGGQRSQRHARRAEAARMT